MKEVKYLFAAYLAAFNDFNELKYEILNKLQQKQYVSNITMTSEKQKKKLAFHRK